MERFVQGVCLGDVLTGYLLRDNVQNAFFKCIIFSCNLGFILKHLQSFQRLQITVVLRAWTRNHVIT